MTETIFRNSLEAKIISTLKAASPERLTVAAVAERLGVDMKPGYNEDTMRIGCKLDKLWKHGLIKCSGLQRNYRTYWA